MRNSKLNWVVFFCGLTLMSLGISLVTQAGLGTTPISTLPLVSAYITGLTFGQTTFLINLLLVLLQWILLRKSVNWTLLLQIPMTFAFSFFIDFFMNLTSAWKTDQLFLSYALNMLGNIVLGAGVALEVYSNAMVLPGEGVVVAFSKVLRKPFSKLKVANDVTLFTAALLLSIAYFGELKGIGWGTLISAVCVGFFVHCWLSLIKKIFEPQTNESDS